MRINTDKIVASFDFSPKDYFLCYSHDDRFPNDKTLKVWTLNPRIDRSYAGKDDDVGIPAIYLEEKNTEELKKYFTVVEY